MSEPTKRTVVLGNFDGLHCGHQRLIQLGRNLADLHREELAVFTFYPQLQEMQDSAFCYLLSEEEKLERLRQLGVDVVESVPFQDNIARLSPEEFVEQILIQRLRAGHVVVGFNFSFGYRGAGNPELLRQLCGQRGVEVTVMATCFVDEEVVSSTAVRNYLRQGNVTQANRLLGYPYHIEGLVVRGNQIGRTIGYPTANIQYLPKLLLPANGVYAALTYVDGRAYPGFLNIGVRPTIEKNIGIVIEVHLFDFQGDLYGQVIRTELHQFLRSEVKFDGLAGLKAQLEQDQQRTKAFFAEQGIFAN